LGLDLRSLALLRIGLSCVVLGDLAIRSSDLTAHYTDDGLLPRHALLEQLADRWHFSLHLFGGTAFFQIVLFSIAGISACLLGLGLYTGPVSFVCWLLTISLQNRNPLLLSGADVLLRMVLFWGMFLPLGARFSLDEMRGKTPHAASNWIVSCGTAAYTLQMIAVYVFAGLIKLHIPAWLDGTGVAYALRAPAFATELAATFSRQHAALATLSTLVPYLELWSPLLLLVPLRTEAFRLLCVALFWGLHIAIALVLDVGIFVPVCFAAWSAFLPAWTWDRLMPVAARRMSGWIRVPFVSAGARHLVTTGRQLAARFSAHTTTTGEVSPIPETRWVSSCKALLCSSFAVYVLAWNLWVFREPALFQMPQDARWIGPLLRVDQRWDMFSRPITESGWFVIPARLSSGAQLDLFSRTRTVTWRRPAIVSKTFSNDRWRKYMLNFAASQHAKMRLFYGRYLCLSWNRQHSGSDTLEAFKIYFMKERVVPWAAPLFVEKEVIWEHECSDGLLRKWRDLL
jgi:hypothetical protein